MGMLKDDIAAFETMGRDLEAHHLKEWVFFHRGHFEGVFPDFESPAEPALDRLDQEPYLIRQDGAGPVHLGGSMIFHPSHGPGRI